MRTSFSAIQLQEFDIIVFATGAVEAVSGAVPLHWEAVSAVYSRNQIVILDGSDSLEPPPEDLFQQLCGTHATCFRRELVCPHPLPKAHQDDQDALSHTSR